MPCNPPLPPPASHFCVSVCSFILSPFTYSSHSILISLFVYSRGSMNWPCCGSRWIDFSFRLCVKPYLNRTRRNFLFPFVEQEWALSFFGEDTFHSILSVFLLLSGISLFSSKPTEIKRAPVMQHLLLPNALPWPFHTWLSFGRLWVFTFECNYRVFLLIHQFYGGW